ncbi:MAG: exodeoxyribonuclease VII large subunit, partial [Halobacteriovoraceae bacterium]|nr:exodeoxyribonuclease VII large subunit [Halobacteriovoraceae bacterium]
MQRNIPTVTQVVNEIKNVLESQFRTVSVMGEVSNLSASGAGHYYFTLSDSQSSISACLFRGDAMRNPLVKNLKDGDKIIASGSVGVYGKRGTFQLITKRIAPAGEGDLKLQLERLKKRLAADGLFDMEIKKDIPKYPQRIGLITAEGSAAYHDFINVINRRSLWFDILFAPAMVQGDRAPDALRKSLFNLIKYNQEASEDKKLDVIVLTRG